MNYHYYYKKRVIDKMEMVETFKYESGNSDKPLGRLQWEDKIFKELGIKDADSGTENDFPTPTGIYYRRDVNGSQLLHPRKGDKMRTIGISEVRSSEAETFSKKDDRTPRGIVTIAKSEIKVGDKVVIDNYFTEVVEEVQTVGEGGGEK